ncbi:transcriptional regulator [Sphaerisporangium rufum]|uniref:Transcriptional regulator n=1 Tax=Sphaerisporangium rufum TaxID=1381558 RepID=A0A919R4A8_9ACTN|nr:helix-turn-helix transcriptional regulator [Sphaerisporangium rufum]GII76865.1 transcriptional regulator [Sphaerisporangium rufum]
MAPRATPTVRLRRLAAELRRLRTAAGLTRDEVTEQTGINGATLYRLEAARARPQVRTLRALLDLYGVDGQLRAELLAILKESAERGWLHTFEPELPDQYAAYIGFEQEARRLLNFESLFIPGLLQTEDYARAVIQGTLPMASRDELDGRLEARMRRQALFARPEPPHLWAVIDEAVLHRRVGGGKVMRAQLQRLLEVADEPYVTLQIVPFGSGAHPGMHGNFIIMQFDQQGGDVIYLESMTNDLFLESDTDIDRYNVVFEHLRAVSSSPAATRTMVGAVLAETMN